jgi:hypothetical protein
MRRIRFTIASLLALIFVLGVGFAALRESSDLWESGLNKRKNFVRIGHSLLALIAALLGGLLSRHLHAGNRERT